MNRLALAAVALLQFACASTGHKAIFYSASAIADQTIDLSGIQHVILRSSLPQEKMAVTRSTGRAHIAGQMKYAIQGYYGKRKDAGVGPVPPGALVFDQERTGSTLTIKSREWQYIHHSMLYASIALFVAPAMDVVVEQYSVEELEKRGGGSQ